MYTPRRTCIKCGGYTRKTGDPCSRCRRLTVKSMQYIVTNTPRGRMARFFDLSNVLLNYNEIAILVGISMNSVQKRVSVGTPLFASRLRS